MKLVWPKGVRAKLWVKYRVRPEELEEAWQDLRHGRKGVAVLYCEVSMKSIPARDRKKKLVRSVEEIPEFRSYLEESEGWEHHELADELMEDGPHVRAEFDRLMGIRRKQPAK